MFPSFTISLCLPSSVSSPLFCLPPPFTSSRLPPASLPQLLPHTGAGPGCADQSRAGRAGGSLGFSLEAQECVESGGTKGAGHRKNGASVAAGEVSQILHSAEWSTWGGRGAGGGHRWCTGAGRALAHDHGNSSHLLAFLGRAQPSKVTVSLPAVACRGKQPAGKAREDMQFSAQQGCRNGGVAPT